MVAPAADRVGEARPGAEVMALGMGAHQKREADLRKGYLCLESEGAEIHFRKVRIMELPAGRAEDLGMGLGAEATKDAK